MLENVAHIHLGLIAFINFLALSLSLFLPLQKFNFIAIKGCSMLKCVADFHFRTDFFFNVGFTSAKNQLDRGCMMSKRMMTKCSIKTWKLLSMWLNLIVLDFINVKMQSTLSLKKKIHTGYLLICTNIALKSTVEIVHSHTLYGGPDSSFFHFGFFFLTFFFFFLSICLNV